MIRPSSTDADGISPAESIVKEPMFIAPELLRSMTSMDAFRDDPLMVELFDRFMFWQQHMRPVFAEVSVAAVAQIRMCRSGPWLTADAPRIRLGIHNSYRNVYPRLLGTSWRSIRTETLPYCRILIFLDRTASAPQPRRSPVRPPRNLSTIRRQSPFAGFDMQYYITPTSLRSEVSSHRAYRTRCSAS